MLVDHGYTGPEWVAAKGEARKILIDIARREELIAYSKLAAQIESMKIEARSPHMFHMLGEISSEEEKEGRGMLTAIVVHKSGNKQPGSGFFDLANSLGKDTSDKLAFWTKELKYVYEFWSK